MADISQSNWSETDSSDNQAAPLGFTSGTMLPSGVEPTGRAIMGAIKRFWDKINGTLTSTGSANVQVLTYAVAPPAYVTGEVYRFIAGFTNAGATTLNVNALGAKAIQYQGAALVGNEIVAGRVATVVYDGTQFQLATSQIPLAAVATSASATDLSAGTLAIARGGTGAGTALAAFNAIVAAAASITPSGYIKLQDGLIIQWGSATLTAASSVALTFPIAFPATLFGVVLSISDATAGTGFSATSLSGFTFGVSKIVTGTGFYIAVGN